MNQEDILFRLQSLQLYRIGIQPGQVILWDIFGEMAGIFPRAQAVFMGGSLCPLGGQNLLEPLLSGAPTITGPYTDDFAWVGEEIFSGNLAQKAGSPAQAVSFLRMALESEQTKEQIRKRTQDYVKNARGGVPAACQAIIQTISGHLYQT